VLFAPSVATAPDVTTVAGEALRRGAYEGGACVDAESNADVD